MTSIGWWKLRNIWHMPNFWGEHISMGSCIDSLVSEAHWWWYRMKKGKKNHILPYWLWGTAMRKVIHMIYWKILWIQPFRCNGNHGGWRTYLCDYLENKARRKEDEEHASYNS